MPELNEKLIQRVEKKFENGENHFIARGVLASLALALTTDTEVRQNTLLDSYERSMRLLQEKNAEGAIYATRTDRGNGMQDGPDRLIITKRDGTDTGETLSSVSDGGIVVRMTTEQIDY